MKRAVVNGFDSTVGVGKVQFKLCDPSRWNRSDVSIEVCYAAVFTAALKIFFDLLRS